MHRTQHNVDGNMTFLRSAFAYVICAVDNIFVWVEMSSRGDVKLIVFTISMYIEDDAGKNVSRSVRKTYKIAYQFREKSSAQMSDWILKITRTRFMSTIYVMVKNIAIIVWENRLLVNIPIRWIKGTVQYCTGINSFPTYYRIYT